MEGLLFSGVKFGLLAFAIGICWHAARDAYETAVALLAGIGAGLRAGLRGPLPLLGFAAATLVLAVCVAWPALQALALPDHFTP